MVYFLRQNTLPFWGSDPSRCRSHCQTLNYRTQTYSHSFGTFGTFGLFGLFGTFGKFGIFGLFGISGTFDWLRLQRNQSVLDRHPHQTGGIMHAQFRHNAGAMLFNRLDTD